jgi:hypothetical protein
MKRKWRAVVGVVLMIVFALTACSSGGDKSLLPTYSISGTVTLNGSALPDIAIALSGASSANTKTDASGNYSFTNLSQGVYIITPAAGYTYSPSSPAVTITNASQIQNFTAASTVTSYSISGTIIYSGPHTGRIYVGLKNSDGSATGYGTSIPSPGTFTIRGIAPGPYYKLSAEMDIRGDGTLNADNPSGEILLNITVTGGGNLPNQDITLTDPVPAAPVTPTGLSVSPSDGVAWIRWNNMTTNYKIIAESYKIYWGKDADAKNGTPITVQANHNTYLQSIPNGVYYYKISALVGTTESALSAVVGPVTIGAGSGLHTVSGTITIPVTPTGPLYVGVYGNGKYYFTLIASPAASQTFSVSGIPNGTYSAFAFLDQNNDNLLGIGNMIVDNNGALPILINNNDATVNMVLSAANALSRVATGHWTGGSSSGYVLNFTVSGTRKLPVQVRLAAGQNIPVPVDIQKANNSTGGFSCSINLIGAVSPVLTDSYRFDITYADGNIEQWTVPVTAVLNSFAQISSVTGTAITPTFHWSVSGSPPAFYSYYIEIIDSTNGNLIWYYPTSTPFGMPSTQTSVLYNYDETASQAFLTSGRTYYLYIYLVDANFNSTSYGVSYTP